MAQAAPAFTEPDRMIAFPPFQGFSCECRLNVDTAFCVF